MTTIHRRSGRTVESTLHFVESASYIDEIVRGEPTGAPVAGDEGGQ